jgi:hypothetical protein
MKKTEEIDEIERREEEKIRRERMLPVDYRTF